MFKKRDRRQMWLRQGTENAQGLPRERHPIQLSFHQNSYCILPIQLHKLCCRIYNKQYRLMEDNLHNQTESVIPIMIAETSKPTQGEGSVIMPTTAASLPVPLGIHVDGATKWKIWSNQFVDLSILLSRQMAQSFQI